MKYQTQCSFSKFIKNDFYRQPLSFSSLFLMFFYSSTGKEAEDAIKHLFQGQGECSPSPPLTQLDGDV